MASIAFFAVLGDPPAVDLVLLLRRLPRRGIGDPLHRVPEEDPLRQTRRGGLSSLADLLLLGGRERGLFDAGLPVIGAQALHGELVGGFRRLAHHEADPTCRDRSCTERQDSGGEPAPWRQVALRAGPAG